MNTNNNSKISKTNNNSKIIHTSSKPIKKMVLWTRKQNAKSSSPCTKQDKNPNIERKKLTKINDSGKKTKNNSKEKNTSSPTIKTKDILNNNNRNNLNNSRITTNKVLNPHATSFQSNSNEENKSNSKFGDSSSKKNDKKPHFFNNIKYKKYINMNFSLNNNNNVNINSSEYHINNTFKYFQSSNGINLRKKKYE